MKFNSTRNVNSPIDFETAALNSYAEDGGLFVPSDIPVLPEEEIEEMCRMPYRQLVVKLLKKFVDEDEIPEAELQRMAEKSYSKFSEPNAVKLVKLKDGLEIAEFFHGPSRTFKDASTFMSAQIISYLLSKKNEKAVVLIGTSGDTGGSVIHAFKDTDNVDVIVWYPEHYCSPLQILSMCTVISDRVHCVSADGSSDDIDMPMKKVFSDKEFTQRYNVISLNSINVLRIILQSALYFFIYGEQLKKKPSMTPFEIVVPVGAAGCLSGGMLAQKMGLPIKLVATTAVNDIICRTLESGDLSVADRVVKTLSPAMDIQIPYNVERMLYFAIESKQELVEIMENFYNTGKAVLSENMHNKVRSLINSYSASDETKKRTMKRCFEENNYKVCPHTAVAVSYHYDRLDRNVDVGVVRLCLATASPAKFPEALLAAQVEPATDLAFENIENLSRKYEIATVEDDWEELMRTKIENIRK